MLKGAVAPLFDALKDLLVQLTDGARTDSIPPECLGYILDLADRHPGQVHFHERRLHGAFPAAIPLNDGGFRENVAQFRNSEVHLGRRCLVGPLIVPGTGAGTLHEPDTRRPLPPCKALSVSSKLWRTTSAPCARSCRSSTSMTGTFLFSCSTLFFLSQLSLQIGCLADLF